MAERTVAQKLLIKPGMTLAIVNAATGYPGVLHLPEDVTVTGDPQGADAILAFATTQAEVEETVATLAAHVGPKTVAWIAYPKGSKTAGFDVNRDTIWAFVPSVGLNTVSQVALDSFWSALRLRPLM